MPGGVTNDTSLLPTVQRAGGEKEGLVKGFRLCEGREGTNITLTDFLAVQKLDKALLGNVLRQELGGNMYACK